MTFRPPKKPALTLDASLVQDDLPLEVVPKMFIGSIHSAFNSESLHHNGITHILNASRLPITFPKLFTYLSVEIRDRDSSNILACIPTTNIFIEAGIESGGVLVHCFGGKSRSAAFVCAYIMSSLGWSFDEAYATVKAARPIVEINAGFECQLRAYHAANCDVYLAQQLLLRVRIRSLRRQRELNQNQIQNQNQSQSQNQSNQPQLQDAGLGWSGSSTRAQDLLSQGASPPLRGLVVDTKAATVPADGDGGMDIVDTPDSQSSAADSQRRGLASLSISTLPAAGGVAEEHASHSHEGGQRSLAPKYDSFYYQRDHNMLPADLAGGGGGRSGPGTLSRLGTQVEIEEGSGRSELGAGGTGGGSHAASVAADRDPEFSFSKTRSISDVYEDSRDPCLEDTGADSSVDGRSHPDRDADPREEEERATYAMLQRKLHYIADSPSSALMLAGSGVGGSGGGGGSKGVMGGVLPNFATLTTSTPTLAPGLNLNLNISTSNSTGNSPSVTVAKSGLGGLGGLGLGLGLSIGTSSDDTRVHSEASHQLPPHSHSQGSGQGGLAPGPELRSIGPSFMQGSGNSSGNRTHRAGALANRGKGRKGRSSSSSSADDNGPPACRLSRPGSSVVRVIPPLRGLERQFRCSWCNTALFTTANVLRTDLDLRPLVERFVATAAPSMLAAPHQGADAGSRSGLAQTGADAAKTERYSVEEYLAQEKQRLSQEAAAALTAAAVGASPAPSVSTSNSGNSRGESLTPPKSGHSGSQSETSPILARSTEPKESGSLSPKLPNIRASSGANTSPIPSRGGAGKDDLSGTSGAGRFPPITMNRSGTNSRSGSSGNLSQVLRGGPGNNETSTEMDVDSPSLSNSTEPPGVAFQRAGTQQSQSRGFGGFSTHSNGGQDNDDFEVMAAPRCPPGGLKTSRAGNSRAFDFDLPMDTESSDGGSSAAAVVDTLATVGEDTATNEDGGEIASYPAGIAGNTPDGGAIPRRGSWDDESVGLVSDSRRNSHGQGQMLPVLLHSKTSPSPSASHRNSPFAEVAISQKNSPRMFDAPPPANPARGVLLHNLSVNTAGVGIAGMGTSPAVHAPASNSATFLHGIGATALGGSPSSSSRSDDSPSPRIHIPPHRQQQQQLTAALLANASPRSRALFQQYPRPQSAEKRRWLARMNLLRQGHSGSPGVGGEGGLLAEATFTSVEEMNPGQERMQVDSSTAVAGNPNPNPSTTSSSSSGNNSSADVKVARMAEADDTASQMIYGGAEKYFYVEYLDWMGGAPLQQGVESGDICCSSCKNVLGGWMWHPTHRLTLGGRLEPPLFRIHKHVVHQVDVQFDATPSSTPRLDDHRKGLDASSVAKG